MRVIFMTGEILSGIVVIGLVATAAMWSSQYVPLIQPLIVSVDESLRSQNISAVQAEIDTAVALDLMEQ